MYIMRLHTRQSYRRILTLWAKLFTVGRGRKSVWIVNVCPSLDESK